MTTAPARSSGARRDRRESRDYCRAHGDTIALRACQRDAEAVTEIVDAGQHIGEGTITE
jgi:hypothetical protein